MDRVMFASPGIAGLSRTIVNGFNLVEFDQLCGTIAELLHLDGRTDPFSGNIVGGGPLEKRVGSLIGYLEQRELLEYLLRALAKG